MPPYIGDSEHNNQQRCSRAPTPEGRLDRPHPHRWLFATISSARTRVGVAVFFCDGGLGFGVTGDYGGASDIRVVCVGIEHSMVVLMAAVAESGPRPGAASATCAGAQA